MKPPFTYFGGKSSVAPQIVALLPPHEHYVEPFAGSLAVLMAKAPSRMETVNDLDGNVMTFWRMLRDRPADLERACALTPHSRAENIGSYDLDVDDDLERARRVWIRFTQGRGGQLKRTGWRFYQDSRGSHSSMPDYLDAYVSRLAPAAVRLRGVSLECKPALELIGDYGRHPDTLIYADPPYPAEVRSLTHGRCRGPDYQHELRTDSKHRELLEALLGCRSAVVLSGYATALYGDLLCTWFRQEIRAQTGNGGDDRERTEVLWSNRPFPAPQATLFDLEAAE